MYSTFTCVDCAYVHINVYKCGTLHCPNMIPIPAEKGPNAPPRLCWLCLCKKLQLLKNSKAPAADIVKLWTFIASDKCPNPNYPICKNVGCIDTPYYNGLTKQTYSYCAIHFQTLLGSMQKCILPGCPNFRHDTYTTCRDHIASDLDSESDDQMSSSDSSDDTGIAAEAPLQFADWINGENWPGFGVDDDINFFNMERCKFQGTFGVCNQPRRRDMTFCKVHMDMLNKQDEEHIAKALKEKREECTKLQARRLYGKVIGRKNLGCVPNYKCRKCGGPRPAKQFDCLDCAAKA